MEKKIKEFSTFFSLLAGLFSATTVVFLIFNHNKIASMLAIIAVVLFIIAIVLFIYKPKQPTKTYNSPFSGENH